MLRTEGLNKSFGSLTVTRDVNLTLERGQRHALIGPNGAGKTTLFNLLTGELKPDRGKVFFGSRDITRDTPDARARAGIARSFQRNNLFDGLTVRENLLTAITLSSGIGHVFWRALKKYPRLRERAETIAQSVGVTDHLDAPVNGLSYGLQRQLEIGLALALDPVVLLLDEPTAGMSPEETANMTTLLGGLPEDLTLLIIEHDMDVLFDIANQVTVLDYGTVLFQGTPDEVRQSEDVRGRYFGAAT